MIDPYSFMPNVVSLGWNISQGGPWSCRLSEGTTDVFTLPHDSSLLSVYEASGTTEYTVGSKTEGVFIPWSLESDQGIRY